MSTFQVDDVELVTRANLYPTRGSEEQWKRKLNSKHIHILGHSPGSFIGEESTASPNPLMGAVGLAYNLHHPLSLSPAAVWLTISQGFGIWITENAEAVRKEFVNHEGQTNIEIEVELNPDWNEVLGVFSEKISDYIGKKHDLFISDFSTATIHDKTASEMVLMHSMSKYFTYSMMTACGFPRITLEGSVEDWERILDRVRTLMDIPAVAADIHMTDWLYSLKGTLDNFILSAKGHPAIEYWKRFYKENAMSGGPYVTGHVLDFFPYLNRDGKILKRVNTRVSPSNFDRGLAKTDLVWKRLGEIWDVEFHAGLVGVSMTPDFTIRPECGWAVIGGRGDTNPAVFGNIFVDE